MKQKPFVQVVIKIINDMEGSIVLCQHAVGAILIERVGPDLDFSSKGHTWAKGKKKSDSLTVACKELSEKVHRNNGRTYSVTWFMNCYRFAKTVDAKTAMELAGRCVPQDWLMKLYSEEKLEQDKMIEAAMQATIIKPVRKSRLAKDADLPSSADIHGLDNPRLIIIPETWEGEEAMENKFLGIQSRFKSHLFEVVKAWNSALERVKKT